MTQLERYSEHYQPTGGLAAEGVLNQLGRPSIEPLEVLVREAVQNCWDAGRRDGPVVVEFGFRTLTNGMAKTLRRRILPDPPPSHPLSESLGERPDLLYIADFGTTGLGGPTRADAEANGATDFIDFVRNVGQPPDKELGGGSFGYGKAAFYLASRARTIVVDTYCSVEQERRLIAYGLGEHYRADGVAFTGRHWWGVPLDGVPEPAKGAEAEELAASLGLPPRDGGRYGTTVALVDPWLAAAGSEERLSPREALEFIGECLLWNFWPKMMMASTTPAAMEFKLLDEGDEVPLADPRTHPRLAPFVEAMDLLRDGQEVVADDPFSLRNDLRSLRPSRLLGTLAIRQTATAVQEEPSGLLTCGAASTEEGLHHVALMRTPELVVNYRSGPAYPMAGRGYAGVFRCNTELDEVFRRSEPPTHDAWIPQALPEREERVFVNVALDRIDRTLREMTAAIVDPAAAAGASIPVGRFADNLASLMPSLSGPGARRASVAPSGSKGRGETANRKGEAGADGSDNGDGGSGPHLPELGTPELRLGQDGTVEIRTPFRLDTDGVAVRVRANIEVLTMDGGQVETEPPIDGAIPRVLRWHAPAREIGGAETVSAGANESGEWEVWITHEPDLMIRVAIDVEAEKG
jgi:hypothetical protein